MPPPRPPARPSLTHFLCIPLVTPASRPQLSASLAAFRADVTGGTASNPPIPGDAVRPLGTLHLTLGVMSLPSSEDIERAVAVLRALRPRDILARVKPAPATVALAATSAPASAGSESGSTGISPSSTSLSLTLRGLHSIQQPEQAAVLYAPPEDPQGVLMGFCQGLRAPFLDAGLIQADDRLLLLHATVVNTVYVKAGGQGRGRGGARGRGKGGQRITVDAREVLDRYDGYSWMEGVPLERIAICRMGARPVDGEDEQAYEVESEIVF